MIRRLPPFIIAIPARYAASRLPGKPLRLLNGKPLIVHVAERALACGAQAVWVATDNRQIADVVAHLPGVQVAMTGEHHHSGTDRLAECADIAGWSEQTCIVNLQGDEPFVPCSAIAQVAMHLHTSGAAMATLAAPIASIDEVFNPNVVKLVRNQQGDVLYFSRAPIPWQRALFPDARQSASPHHWLRHIGLYAYTVGFLRTFTALKPSPLEHMESLEQLRVLEAGYRIAAVMTSDHLSPGIDTPEDLARAHIQLARQ